MSTQTAQLYRAYSPDLIVKTCPPAGETFVRRTADHRNQSPSKTLHLYEQRLLPSLPAFSTTQFLLDEYQSLYSDSDSSESGDSQPRQYHHIAACKKDDEAQDLDLSAELSLFPLPLKVGKRSTKLSDHIDLDFENTLTPPVSRYALSPTPSLPGSDLSAADVPSAASMELERHHSSWSIAVYSPTSTIALFRLPVKRNRHFMRKQNSKSMSRVAMMCAGLRDPIKVVVTGYLDKPEGLPHYQISNSLWTCRTMELCQDIGHIPALSLHDKGIAGLHHCCHAEKLAVTYMHHQHPALKKATIHLSDDPCWDCARFLRKYQAKFDKKIDIVVYGWRWQDHAGSRHLGTTLRTTL